MKFLRCKNISINGSKIKYSFKNNLKVPANIDAAPTST